MTYGQRALQILSGFGLILLATAVAQASIIGTGTPFTGNDSANWQNYGTVLGASVVNGSTLVALDNTLTFDFSDLDAGQIWLENGLSGGTNFDGGFSSGEYLVSTLDSAAPSTPDTLKITLSSPVSEFGLYVEEFDFSNNFSATRSTDGGSVSYTSPTVKGEPVFVGLVSTSADITSITLSTAGPEAGDFLIGTAYFQDGSATVATPEPASLMLVVGAIAAMVWKARKRVRA
jgi:hypothetical protein